MQNGCKRDVCVNVFCKNNPNFKFLNFSEQDLQKEAINLWKDYAEEKKYQYEQICCDEDLMKNIYPSV